MRRTFSICIVLILAVRAVAENTAVPDPPPNQPPQVRRDADLQLVSAGESASSKNTADRAVLEQKLVELNRLQSEIDALRRSTGTPQQILVRFVVTEVARTRMRQLGIDFARIDPAGEIKSHQVTPAAGTESSFDLNVLGQTDAFHGFLGALKQNNIAKVLAEPSIVVLSGRPASINIGGEIPLPAKAGANSQTEFVSAGTQVDVVANAIGNNRVRLDLRMRVSGTEGARTIMIDGTPTPILNVRQIDTGMELAFGQSAVFGGMVQVRTETIETEAGRTSVPVETELLFIATPELIAPPVTSQN
jgi:Flp pilus assembly secretin CpaC